MNKSERMTVLGTVVAMTLLLSMLTAYLTWGWKTYSLVMSGDPGP